MEFELACSHRVWFSGTASRRERLPMGPRVLRRVLEDFRTAESKRSASEESSDCLLPKKLQALDSSLIAVLNQLVL